MKSEGNLWIWLLTFHELLLCLREYAPKKLDDYEIFVYLFINIC